MHEAQLHDRCSFVTLTYDDEHLPEDHSLHVEHWQKFAKRLRKEIGRFRFYHCGEYGPATLRPHYHAAMFGVDFHRDRELFKSTGDYPLYLSQTLQKAWGLGFTTIGNLTAQSARYVAKYVTKKITGPAAEKNYERVDAETGEVITVRPEYSTMSRRPGIGAGWYEKFGADVRRTGFVVINGRKTRAPAFYDRRHEEVDPEGYEEVKKARRDRVLLHAEDQTWERLAVREEVLRSKFRESHGGIA